jgi:phosphatidylglycerol:prolipoprotein diacylglycerol transferase
MLTYPSIDPVALQLGPLKIHWYGIMYLVGFSAAWWLGKLRASRPNSILNKEQIADLIFYGALGAVLGGRIGYILFYDIGNYMAEPLNIFKVWQGGMSFHGGFIGVGIATLIYSRKIRKKFFQVTDFLVPLTPIGLGMGRIGNFINGELWGKPTDVAWGMVFPYVDQLPRHPSQLYQVILEGVLLFIIVWFYSRKPRPAMAVSGLFILCYGGFRFLVEFARQPDAHIGYLAFGWLTMGQVLSFPMMLIGVAMMGLAHKNHSNTTANQAGPQ